ncbi:MAG: hypothetical protein CMM00_10790, partial [Rhodopirellula sp.]|nr:hypothetical protein [Rhodopirellula sp.]
MSNSPDEPELIGDPAGQAMRRLADSLKESGSDDASSWADRLEASHADSMGDLTRDQTHSEVGFEVESF